MAPSQVSQLLENEPPEASINKKPQQYQIDMSKTKSIYDFCIDTKVITNGITEVDFVKDVSEGNFKTIHSNAEQQKSKSKCKYIIYVLSSHIGNEWYLAATRSINIEPNRCSGINVPNAWKKQANALK